MKTDDGDWQPYVEEFGYLKVLKDADLNQLSAQIRMLFICSNIGNSVTSIIFYEYSYLFQLEIQDNCFMNIEQFVMDGLNSLQSIKIGEKSFTNARDILSLLSLTGN